MKNKLSDLNNHLFAQLERHGFQDPSTPPDGELAARLWRYGNDYTKGDGASESRARDMQDAAALLNFYRAQPQAREDAQPVGWTEDMERERREADYERGFRHGKKSALDDACSKPVAWRSRLLDAFGDGAWAVTTYKPSADKVEPLYTHPARHALRVAVSDAMVEAACSRFVSESDDIWSASVWPEGPDDDGDRGDGGRVRLISEDDQHNIRAAMRFALTDALAALQAEQKGGA